MVHTVMTKLMRQRQEDFKFKASMDYVARPHLKNNKQTKTNITANNSVVLGKLMTENKIINRSIKIAFLLDTFIIQKGKQH
jgi:hypothetical protein